MLILNAWMWICKATRVFVLLCLFGAIMVVTGIPSLALIAFGLSAFTGFSPGACLLFTLFALTTHCTLEIFDSKWFKALRGPRLKKGWW